MRKGLEPGITQRFNRTMVYKMISPLAQFHTEYRGIDEVIIDTNTLEASSRVCFSDVKATGEFHTHPAYIDGLSQSSGFVMNCNDGNDLDREVFVNHGWKSLQLFEKLRPDRTYSTYVRMVEKANRMFEGDMLVFDGDIVVANYEGLVVSSRLPMRSEPKPDTAVLTMSSRKVYHDESYAMSCLWKAVTNLVRTAPNRISGHPALRLWLRRLLRQCKETLKSDVEKPANQLNSIDRISSILPYRSYRRKVAWL